MAFVVATRIVALVYLGSAEAIPVRFRKNNRSSTRTNLAMTVKLRRLGSIPSLGLLLLPHSAQSTHLAIICQGVTVGDLERH